MGLGIGLGAFMQGFERGIGLGSRLQDIKRDREQRERIEKIDSETKAKFDEGVAAGTYKPEQFDDFWLKYALPKRKVELLRSGDTAGAERLSRWGESEAALKGGRLFSSAIFKAQTGDHAGALDDAIEAGKVKGYINHGYEFLGKDELRDNGGALVGYRVKLKGTDGNEITQDIKTGDIPRVVALLANPDAAWRSQLETQRDEEQSKRRVSEHEEKKRIDARYPTRDPDHPGKVFDEAFKELNKDIGFQQLSPDEQEQRIRDHLARRRRFSGEQAATGLGRAAPAERSVVFDTVTGKPVQPGIAAPRNGRAAPEQPAPKAAPVAPTKPADVPATGAVQLSPVQQYALARAHSMMSRGAPQDRIRSTLKLGGVPLEMWPADLRSAGN